MSLKSLLLPLVWATSLTLACANTAPTVVIQSATMRPGTTLMDVVYRVNDPDDATVKTRALAFVDGVRSFAKVLKPVTFVEGTATKLGDAIPSNTNHTLTWDVATDWNIDLGQVKFEVLAMDARGLLPIDWITIPAAGGQPAMTISKNSPTDAEVLDAFFWQYADGDPWLTLANGVLTGNTGSGVFADYVLANGITLQSYSTAYIFKKMNLDPANSTETGYASNTARAGLLTTSNWHAVNRPYTSVSIVVGWGHNGYGQTTIPAGLTDIISVATGEYHSLALKSDGTFIGWGWNFYGQATAPTGLTGVIALAAGYEHSLALKGDGTVVAWGGNDYGQATVPAGLTGVIAVAASDNHSLALKSNGTVVGWGDNNSGQSTVPASLTGVTMIATGYFHSLALKSNRTVTCWGNNDSNQIVPPSGLTEVIAIAAGFTHSLALRSNGTIVGWGDNSLGQASAPTGLTGVTAIAAGNAHSLAVKSDGTVVGWGHNDSGQVTIPLGMKGVSKIAAGGHNSLALKLRAP